MTQKNEISEQPRHIREGTGEAVAGLAIMSAGTVGGFCVAAIETARSLHAQTQIALTGRELVHQPPQNIKEVIIMSGLIVASGLATVIHGIHRQNQSIGH